jgi:S-adenosylmethionine hydrolase
MASIHSGRPPIVTLLSDFGTADAYVAVMKAAVLRLCPSAALIDVTHAVPPQDILAAGFPLERAIAGFDPGTIHVAVVDPGVGTARRILIVEIARQIVICPDNGLITWTWRRHGGGRTHDVTWRPERPSDVFHGRDIMAPVAGMLAAGEPIEALSRESEDPMLLEIGIATGRLGRVIHIDGFGNATTNLLTDRVGAKFANVTVAGRSIGPIRRTYSDVTLGEPLAIIGSSGLLEVAVRNGSAAKQLGITVGEEVTLE